MKLFVASVLAALTLCALAAAPIDIAHAAPGAGADPSPIFGIRLPAGFRDWKVVTVAHEAGKNNDLRVVLGNDLAIKAFRTGKLPFPDGAIIVRMAWRYTPSAVNNRSFGDAQSFVAGTPINTQVDVKDTKKYASTGGWGFSQFKNGKPDPTAALQTCYACHTLVRSNDFVFTHYAPTP
jgi:hypothetical protein